MNYLQNTEGLILGCLLLAAFGLACRVLFGPADQTPPNDGQDIDEPVALEGLEPFTDEEVDAMFLGVDEPVSDLWERLSEDMPQSDTNEQEGDGKKS